MASSTVRVKGLREVQRAFREMDKATAKTVRDGLKEAARPVAEAAQAKLSRYPGASVQTIRPRASVRGAFVTQGAKKVTGKRGDFGVLQMRRLGEALDEKQPEVIAGVEDVIDLLGRRNGF